MMMMLMMMIMMMIMMMMIMMMLMMIIMMMMNMILITCVPACRANIDIVVDGMRSYCSLQHIGVDEDILLEDE